MTKIAIGLPSFNEEKNIASIILQLKKNYELILVCDDGSSDLTAAISEKMGAIVIKHKKNLGYGAAIRSLFLKAHELECDILVTFDSDGQHRVLDIETVVAPILKNDADIVIGSRFLGSIKGEIPSYRKFGMNTITNLVNANTEKKITDSQSGFRAYNKTVLEKIIPSESGMGVSTEILIKANKYKFRIIEVPITIHYEGDTSSQNALSHGTSVILSTMKFISIEHPLKFYGIPGIAFLVLGLFFIVWTLQEFTATGRIITNISLIATGSTIFGMILTMNSVLLYSLVSVVRERR
ncbi:glycosyltransferase family 2 protein [Candidatus Nitrosarchaeum limnium]|uniref:Glycosyltransferase, group 2 family protein n=1 Tax=Candidatus Nitrosarchaeum limnium BG20 TaxID=859192 RepID=S2E1X8_9ARCH|nr:glycosyltransferase family 2 protein [Candidatus Nitrosarchaeum limnium]EPA05345.1 glycosyltransferase, group 2 family protein [Candidatus Nitrosarchaeum limnium BG20]